VDLFSIEDRCKERAVQTQKLKEAQAFSRFGVNAYGTLLGVCPVQSPGLERWKWLAKGSVGIMLRLVVQVSNNEPHMHQLGMGYFGLARATSIKGLAGRQTNLV